MADLDFTGGLDWNALEKNLGANITKEKNDYNDNRMWKLSRDENDTGGAIIRLLPDPKGVPFIQRFNHAFSSFDNVQKKKRWYINISPETFGDRCPASELWSALYGLGTEEGQKEARIFGRKIKFMANIKVIKDPGNPANEGKIFLWEFGTKLKDKFIAALQPSDSEIAMGEEPKQLFNPLSGCNIKLRIKKAGGFLNYDDTEIMPASSVYTNAEEAKKDILDNAFLLSEFMKRDSVETYEELHKKMKYVLEAYNPEFVAPILFKSIVNKVINKEPVEIPKEVEQETPVETPKEVKQETPVETSKEVKQEVKPVETSGDDDLSFLDSL